MGRLRQYEFAETIRNAVATTLYSTTETTRGTVTEITACITGTTTCSQQRVEFNAIPKLSGQLQLEGKALLQNSLPASWISNTQFELGETATGGDGNYIWKSSDDNVATVDDHGSVTIKDQLADFTITITTLGRTSDDANSLHVKKGNEMLHVTSDLETYADAKNNCASAGRKMPEIADFQRITALWGHMASYPTYAAMPQYVWANSEEAADVGSAYRMKDGKVQNNIVKTDPNYQGCLE